MPRRARRDWGRGWVERRQRASGVRYVARWLEDGAQRSKTFTAEHDAWDHLDDRARRARRQPAQPGVVTVADAVASWLHAGRHRWAASTRYAYDQIARDYVLPAFGATRLDRLQPDHINRYLDTLSHQRSPAMVRQVGIVLSAALRHAVLAGMVDQSPYRGIVVPRKAQRSYTLWTRAEARRLLDTVQVSPWWHAAYAVLLGTGIRRGELLALRWADVDQDRGALHVRRTVTPGADGRPVMGETTKGRTARRIALTATAAAALGRMPRHHELVFCRADGTMAHASTLRHQHLAWCGAAGVPHIRLHDIRHSVATWLLEANVNPKVVSEILGHASTATTLETYQHVGEGLTRQAAGVLDGWD